MNKLTNLRNDWGRGWRKPGLYFCSSRNQKFPLPSEEQKPYGKKINKRKKAERRDLDEWAMAGWYSPKSQYRSPPPL